VLVDPGEQDLTSHVDFEALTRTATSAGAAVTAVATQGEWLKRLGIEGRAAALVRSNPERADDIQTALERLTGAGHMGELFKVVAVHCRDWPSPVGFA
jgi:SAM-dependent MidA family methyltransferase